MFAGLDYKRILLAILLVLISIGLVVGIIWLLFVRPTDSRPEVPGTVSEPGGGLPGVGPGGDINIIGPGGRLIGSGDIDGGEEDGLDGGDGEFSPSLVADGSLTQVERVAEERVKDINLSQGGFNYLSQEDNRFYRLPFDELERLPLSADSFPNVDKVTWAGDGRKVVLEYPDGANIVYDFTENKQVTLPRGMEDPMFDSDSQAIAYKFVGGGEEDNWLVVSDTLGGNSEVIEPLGGNQDKVQVSWSPDNQVVALYHKPIGLNKEEVFFVGLNQENFKSLVVEGSSFKGLWSPKGDKLLYHVVSQADGYNPVLWVVDSRGETIGNNNFNLVLSTWVDKCVFSQNGREVYCAVPLELPQGTGLYPDLLAKSADVFYKIDLSTGITQLLAFPVLSEEVDEFQVQKLLLSDDESKLFFLDNFTEKMYYMRLK